MEESTLVQYAQAGDLTAFNRLVLEYQDLAFSVAYRVMGESAAAEDAVQDSFIKAYRSLDSFRGGSFKSWMMRIVTNTCYDELRRRKRRPTIPLEPMTSDDEEIESPKWIMDPGESPEDFTIRAELGEAIQECLSRLSADFRMVVVLVDVQGMDYSEAAAVINSPLGTVKSRLARARRGLRDCLRGFSELLPTAMRFEDELIA